MEEIFIGISPPSFIINKILYNNDDVKVKTNKY